MHLHAPRTNGCGEDFFAKVLIRSLVQYIEQEVAVENVQAHTGQAITTTRLNASRVDPFRRSAHHVDFTIGLRLFEKAFHAAGFIATHHAQAWGHLPIDRNSGNRYIGFVVDVRAEHVHVVHPVQLVTRQDQYMLQVLLIQVPEVLPHSIGRALIPIGTTFHGLLSRQQFHETAAEIVKAIRLSDMAMQGNRQELSQHKDAIDVAVDTVGDRDINQPILAGQRYSRFGANLG